jgi:peptide/nickel transport system substrate-binding protein
LAEESAAMPENGRFFNQPSGSDATVPLGRAYSAVDGSEGRTMGRHPSRRTKRGSYGFTLIELLVVITILGILAAVVVFSVRGVTDKGQSAALATDAATLRTAEEAYCAKFGYYASDKAALASAQLLSSSSGGINTIESNGVAGPCGPGTDPAKPSGFRIVCTVTATQGCIGAQAAGAAIRGGTLVVGETFSSNTTTNVASSTGGGTHAWWEAMYNGLIALDEAGNPSPELVTPVPTVANGGITNGGATYTLHLRPGVTWHDGSAFTANDVKFTFEKILLQFHARAKNMNVPLGYSAAPSCTASNIVVIDPLTVQFNFTNPYVPFLKQLNVTEAAMNQASSLSGAFPPGVAGCPSQTQADSIKIGTGPFMFSSINTPQASDGKVVKNPNYWKAGLPFLDGILMRPFTTDAPRTAALSSGAVDFVWDVPNPDVATFQASSSFKTVATQSLGGGPNSVDQVIFNLRASGSSVASVANGTAPPHPILGDLNVRKAIFQALNRADYLNIGRNGIGTVSKSPISSQIFGSETDIPLPSFDPTSANTFLDAAHWNGPRTTCNGTANVRTALGHPTLADGACLTIRFLQGSATFNDRVAVIKSNLNTVGIDMPVTQNFATSGTTATTQVFTNRDFDLYIVNYANGYDPHIGVRRQYAIDQISTSGTPNNAAGYRNALVDADFDNAVKTLDTATRYSLYHDFQARVVADLPYVWMIETPNVRGFKAKCAGFQVFTGLFAESASCSA